MRSSELKRCVALVEWWPRADGIVSSWMTAASISRTFPPLSFPSMRMYYRWYEIAVVLRGSLGEHHLIFCQRVLDLNIDSAAWML